MCTLRFLNHQNNNCTQKDVYGITRTCRIKIRPDFRLLHAIFRILRYLKSRTFQGTSFSLMFFHHLHNNNDNAHKLFFASSQKLNLLFNYDKWICPPAFLLLVTLKPHLLLLLFFYMFISISSTSTPTFNILLLLYLMSHF